MHDGIGGLAFQLLRRDSVRRPAYVTAGCRLRSASRSNAIPVAASTAPRLALQAVLGEAEVELLSGDTAAAVARSQDALNMATTLQGGVPYSCHAGLSRLMLGRALQARGDIPQARKAFETAITHLSNTVDADHPELLRARRLLASIAGTG